MWRIRWKTDDPNPTLQVCDSSSGVTLDICKGASQGETFVYGTTGTFYLDLALSGPWTVNIDYAEDCLEVPIVSSEQALELRGAGAVRTYAIEVPRDIAAWEVSWACEDEQSRIDVFSSDDERPVAWWGRRARRQLPRKRRSRHLLFGDRHARALGALHPRGGRRDEVDRTFRSRRALPTPPRVGRLDRARVRQGRGA